MQVISDKLKTRPIHLALLPFFFTLHGFTENFPLVPVSNAVVLTFVYTAASVIFCSIFFLALKNFIKAALLASMVMAFHFFFGNVHDFIKSILGSGFFTRYGVIISMTLILLVFLFLLIRKRKTPYKFTSYFNILLLILVVIDGSLLVGRLITGKSAQSYAKMDASFTQCDTCAKPDVYIILLDEYAGQRELTDIFKFDNHVFLDSLKYKGFKTIANSSSNYNYTPYSTASLLAMEYLDEKKTMNTQKGFRYAVNKIDNNQCINFFLSRGYDFYNCSPFTVAGKTASIEGSFVPKGTGLITSGTFISRFEKDVLLNLANKLNWNWYIKKKMYSTLHDNRQLYELTGNIAKTKKGPKIVYTHLLMPHYPFYYTESGELYSFDDLKKISLSDTSAYLSYLKYTNNTILDLVNNILKNSSSPPVIVILSDHGYRHFSDKDPGYFFSNLITVHTPSQNYNGYSDTMSNVNILKSILNSEFGQRLEMEKDKTYLIDF
jgi:hypothetical protein